MIDGKKVVAWTPYGREATYSILLKYFARDVERGLIDEVRAFLNTDPNQVDDLRYIYRQAKRTPWLKLWERPAGVPRRTPKQRNTGYAYTYMTDPDTAYVRFDDDIIYVHQDAVENLVRHKLQTPNNVCSMSTMWNNSITSWFFQQSGVIPAAGTRDDNGYVWPAVGGPYCMDPVGWADGEFAVNIHRLLLDKIRNNCVEDVFLYQDMPVKIGQQYSVSCFASLGAYYAALPQPGVLVPDEEEGWHTVFEPNRIQQPNILVGNAVVSHYTFMPQRGLVAATDVLDQYREIAEKL